MENPLSCNRVPKGLHEAFRIASKVKYATEVGHDTLDIAVFMSNTNCQKNELSLIEA